MTSKPRYKYALLWGSIYRFKYSDWLAFLKKVASNQETDVGPYSVCLGQAKDISDILPKEAEDLLNEQH